MTTMFSNLAGSDQLVVSLAGVFLVYAIYKLSTFIHDQVTSPLRDVPGPPSPSLLYGNFKELLTSVSSEVHTISFSLLEQ